MEHILEYVYQIVSKKLKLYHDKEKLIKDYQGCYKFNDPNVILPLISDDFLKHSKVEISKELYWQFEAWFKARCEQDLKESYPHENN